MMRLQIHVICKHQKMNTPRDEQGGGGQQNLQNPATERHRGQQATAGRLLSTQAFSLYDTFIAYSHK